MSFRVPFIRAAVVRAAVVSLALAGVTMAEDDPVADWEYLTTAALEAASVQNYASAEQLMLKAVHVSDKFPPGDGRMGIALNTLGLVYIQEKKYADAEKTLQKALAILEKAFGSDSLDAGSANFNIASVLAAEGHWENALPYIQKSRTVFTIILGPDSLKVASTLCLTGEAYRNLKKPYDAEAPLKKCADTREAANGVENPELADALYNLGLVYQQEGKYALADPTLKMSAKIREITLGVTSPEFAEALEARSALLRVMGRAQEADRDAAMAAAVRRNAKKTQ